MGRGTNFVKVYEYEYEKPSNSQWVCICMLSHVNRKSCCARTILNVREEIKLIKIQSAASEEAPPLPPPPPLSSNMFILNTVWIKLKKYVPECKEKGPPHYTGNNFFNFTLSRRLEGTFNLPFVIALGFIRLKLRLHKLLIKRRRRRKKRKETSRNYGN